MLSFDGKSLFILIANVFFLFERLLGAMFHAYNFIIIDLFFYMNFIQRIKIICYPH